MIQHPALIPQDRKPFSLGLTKILSRGVERDPFDAGRSLDRARDDGNSKVCHPDQAKRVEGSPTGDEGNCARDDIDLEMGMDFGIFVQSEGQCFEETSNDETAWLLMSGSALVEAQGEEGQRLSLTITRISLFHEGPSVLHCGPGTCVRLVAKSPHVEWARVGVANTLSFEPKVFLPADVGTEFRGRGLVENTCLRVVRQVFDRTNREHSNLVLGEVLNSPGRWSSYPPHHHVQPEIYHYRFNQEQGYGHAELGDEVLKVKTGDTVKIQGGKDHAQVSAPGYAMYYLWVIRHLPKEPYTGFEFTDEHKWVFDPTHLAHKTFAMSLENLS